MIVKPSIGFLTRDSNAQLGVSIDTITSALTGNASYPPADSGVTDVIVLNAAFKQAVIDAASGGYALTAARNAKRAELVIRVRLLALYVEMTSQGDMAVLLSSGFPAQKAERTPASILPAPMIQSVVTGSNSGTVAVKLISQGALVYNWRCYQAAAPEKVTTLPQTSAASVLFTGLTPGAAYCFQGNAVNSAGVSDWSELYSQIAL